MKKIVVLAGLAIVLGSAHFSAHAANATPIVVARAEALTIKPETAAPKGTTTDDPKVPPVVVADGGNCSGC